MKYAELCEVYEQLKKNPGRLKKVEIFSEFLKKLNLEDTEIIYLLKGKVFADYSEKEFGISEKLVIKSLAKASGVSDKEIVSSWRKQGDLGDVAESIMEKKKQNTLFSSSLTTQKIFENLRKLPELEGKGTVEKKLSLIAELLTSASPQESKYIVRTLLSDLRIGVADGTLRDSIVKACFGSETEAEQTKKIVELVQESYDISTDWRLVFEHACKGSSYLEKTLLEPGKPVKVMLFLKESSIKDGFARVGKPALIDYKYDGFRMLITKNKKEIKIFTRRLDEVTKQFPEVKEYVEKFVEAESVMLDCEAVGYDPKTKRYKPFQEISQRIKRKYDIEKLQKELPIEINVFDMLYHDGESLLKKPFIERRRLLEKIIRKQAFKIRPSQAIITDNESEAQDFYEKVLQSGEEGIMMKNLEAPYKPGARVGYGVKIKPIDNEFDLVIVEAEYGTGKRAGWLTSYTVACRDHDDLLEIGKVSTGLKEKEAEGLSFIELTKRLKPLTISEEGRMVKVKPEIVVTVVYQNIQKSPTYSSGYALRFPRITRLREDRPSKDIATLQEIRKEVEKG
ncbi:MAG: hypothetical protein RL557_102 [archaeon]|jgi:DNA ligase-1